MSDERRNLQLTVLHERFSVCRLDAAEAVPQWFGGGALASVTRTSDELSIIAPSSIVPADMRRSDGWRALKLLGPFAFSASGVLASVVSPLAGAGISVLATCTFDTDYILVQESDLSNAIGTLAHVGHRVSRAVSSVPNDQVRDEVDQLLRGGEEC